jgi:hypothetical protein
MIMTTSLIIVGLLAAVSGVQGQTTVRSQTTAWKEEVSGNKWGTESNACECYSITGFCLHGMRDHCQQCIHLCHLLLMCQMFVSAAQLCDAFSEEVRV